MAYRWAPDPKTQAARVKHGKPPQRAKHWRDKAVAFAHQHRLDAKGVIDMHDHIADMLEWEGATRAEAEWRAWDQTVDILAPRAVAGAA